MSQPFHAGGRPHHLRRLFLLGFFSTLLASAAPGLAGVAPVKGGLEIP
jgi:hypothetical protein